MKPAAFDYVRADSAAVAAELLQRHGEGARILAGGQSLMAVLNMRLAQPSVLIDISRTEELDFVRSLDQKVGRPGGRPTFYVPFSDGNIRLVMELPPRLDPRYYQAQWEFVVQKVLPALLAILLGTLLYRLFIAPLVILRRQA